MSSLFASLTVALSLAIFRRVQPVRTEGQGSTLPPFAVLRKKYWRFDLGLLVVALVAMTAFSALVTWLLLRLSGWRYHSLAGEALFFIEPSLRMWTVCGVLFAVPATVVVLDRYSSWKLGADYAEYRAYYNLKYKFDGWRAMRWLQAALLLGATVLTGLLLNWYTAFYNDGITFRSFGAFSARTYSYSAVKRLSQQDFYEAPNGKTIDRNVFQIEFADGVIWNSGTAGYSDDLANAEVLDFVAAHTGVAVEESTDD
jgi:hypothetical protein